MITKLNKSNYEIYKTQSISKITKVKYKRITKYKRKLIAHRNFNVTKLIYPIALM